MKYPIVQFYTKETDLMEYFRHNGGVNLCKDAQARYEKKRNVQLYVFVRHENGRYFCEVKCPINPLPVKGEFETPSMAVLKRFLEANGWTFQNTLNLALPTK